MKHMAEAKNRYDDIPIPKELSERVMAEVEKAQARNREQMARKRRKTFMKRGMAAAAAAVVLFTAGVNTSEVFARELRDIPVLGTMARILTFRSYESETEDLKISVDIPSVEMISEELSGLEEAVNEEIHIFCQQYADAAVERAEEYRQAFLDTGGTEEEWVAHHIEIKVWYEVKSQTDRYISLAVMGSENWTSAYSETKYYNFDQETGKWITLEDVLGKDYARIAEQSVRQQIEQRETEDGMEYWVDEWEGISEDTRFYMNSTGNPVIVFDQYEIAPGAAGMPEFEIGLTQEDVNAGSTILSKEDAGMQQAETSEETTELRDDYKDNFDVDEKAVAEFGRMIKEAVAQKDVEMLADLTGFPVYVGLSGGREVETRDDFIALDVEELLSDEMVNSIAEADENNLSPSMAGFTLYGSNGDPSITFGVREGRLAISGINYGY